MGGAIEGRDIERLERAADLLPALADEIRATCRASGPREALAAIRRVAELALTNMARQHGLALPKHAALDVLRARLLESGHLPDHLGPHILSIQHYGNVGAHPTVAADPSHVRAATAALVALLDWLAASAPRQEPGRRLGGWVSERAGASWRGLLVGMAAATVVGVVAAWLLQGPGTTDRAAQALVRAASGVIWGPRGGGTASGSVADGDTSSRPPSALDGHSADEPDSHTADAHVDASSRPEAPVDGGRTVDGGSDERARAVSRDGAAHAGSASGGDRARDEPDVTTADARKTESSDLGRPPSQLWVSLRTLDDDGRWRLVAPGESLPVGAAFAFEVVSDIDAYFYVAQMTESGKSAVIFPEHEGHVRVKAGKLVRIPPTDPPFYVWSPAGRETFVWLLSPNRVDLTPILGGPPRPGRTGDDLLAVLERSQRGIAKRSRPVAVPARPDRSGSFVFLLQEAAGEPSAHIGVLTYTTVEPPRQGKE